MNHRDYIQRTQMQPGFWLRARAHWMTDEQWRQLEDYCDGKAIPTDPEVVEGLRFTDARRHESRSADWFYSTVSGYIVNEPNYSDWCRCIRDAHPIDPDMTVDEGL